MRIITVDDEPVEIIPYLTIPPQQHDPAGFSLPILKGLVDKLPGDIDAIIVASDLQGRWIQGGQDLLLGEAVSESLQLLIAVYMPELNPQRALVLLCGDLYTDLQKRGQSGDPIKVWQALATAFGHVIGIAGNHDDFGNSMELLNAIGNVDFINNGTIVFKGLKIAGLSGIIGRPDKLFRLSETEYLGALSKLLKKSPDILLTHLSPSIPATSLEGDRIVFDQLIKGNKTLNFCGHSHWDVNQPQELKNGTQIMNVDGRVLILTA